MRFSTSEMKHAANYIADHLEYRDCNDDEALIKAQRNIASRIYERLTHIERQFPTEKVINIHRNDPLFKTFFSELEKENIFYPPFKDFNLFYALGVFAKNKKFGSLENHKSNRVDKKMALIIESLEACKLEQDEEEWSDSLHYSENVSDYNDDDENDIFVPNASPVRSVDFDENTQNYFNELTSLTEGVYLTGGKTIDLVTQQKKSTDHDFVIEPVEGMELKNAGYKLDIFDKQRKSSYKKEPTPVDVRMVSSIATHPDSWMLANVLKRDFTICMLLIDRHKNAYDPTGCALPDIEKKILRFYDKDANARVYKDPCCIIRAMKYIERGYEPDEKTDIALRFLNHLEKKHKERVYSATRKLFKKSSPEQKNKFICLLDQYGQLKTLFNLTINSKTEETVKQLENLVKKHRNCHRTPNLGFSEYFMSTTKQIPNSKAKAENDQLQKRYYQLKK